MRDCHAPCRHWQLDVRIASVPLMLRYFICKKNTRESCRLCRMLKKLKEIMLQVKRDEGGERNDKRQLLHAVYASFARRF